MPYGLGSCDSWRRLKDPGSIPGMYSSTHSTFVLSREFVGQGRGERDWVYLPRTEVDELTLYQWQNGLLRTSTNALEHYCVDLVTVA